MDIENKKCYNNERGEARISFEQLTLADDFMFFKVMQDENLCRQLLEVILNKPIEKIVYVKNQESAQTTYDAKCIRMDVYVKDKNHTIYNIEMQKRNTKELPQRTRYYHSTVDQTQLKRGQDYNKLPDSYVIFICTFDLFGVGFGKYTFEPVCIEDKNIHLCDGSHTIFVNAKGVTDDQKLQEFIDYLRTGKVSESLFIKQLDDAVKVPYDIEGVYEGEAEMFIPIARLGEAINDFRHIDGLSYNITEQEIAQIMLDWERCQ